MRRRSYELWYALVAIILITALYVLVVVRRQAIPGSGDLFGHLIGVAGFVLMLMTETLYSLRKRSERARWGRMAWWLQFHIFTGLVGPYMVLLHTAWKFNGLAGATTLLTVIVVVSGFIGRYIYTAVPRSAEGAELLAKDLNLQIIAAESALQHWLAASPEQTRGLARSLAEMSQPSQGALWLVLGRPFIEWRYRRLWRREKERLAEMGRDQAQTLEKLVERRRVLSRQKASLAMARQLLSLWHAIHVPLGMALFTAAFIHIGAALYYATLLK